MPKLNDVKGKSVRSNKNRFAALETPEWECGHQHGLEKY